MKKSLRRLGLTLIFAALLGGVAGSTQPGSAASPIRYYTATISPTSVPAGSTYNATVTITNSSVSTDGVAAATVTTPAGFTLSSAGPASAFGGKSWNVSTSGGLIQLRAAHNSDTLNHDEWVSVPVTATTSCTLANYTWATTASGSGSNQAFQLQANTSDPQTTVTAGGGSAADHFDVTLPSSPFTATAGTSFTAQFAAKDVCNNPASGYSGTASLTSTLHAAPNGATPTVPSSITFSSGTASASITAVDVETGRTLTATAGTVAGRATSSTSSRARRTTSRLRGSRR